MQYQYIRINGDVTAQEKLTAQQIAGHPMAAKADGFFIEDLSESFEDSEKAISFLRTLCNAVPADVIAKVRAKKQEDIKKILYAGCSRAVVALGPETGFDYIHDVSTRFGKDKIVAMLPEGCPEGVLTGQIAEQVCAVIAAEPAGETAGLPVLRPDAEEGILTVPDDFCTGSRMHVIPWAELKKGPDGLVPCIVQDDANDEVLMMAWMDEAAYEDTLATGRMTYFSRSRQERWVKGETSGHFQYLKSLKIDCDADTLLARVTQIGAACHTGNRSCFFTDLVEAGSAAHRPGKVFEDVYGIIADRKAHPKEGSYTNYLFEKGIDKILKKLGEEATEIVIAAKNPDKEEVKYEIADFLYHAMVLMVEKDVTWAEITTELARR